MRRKLIVVLLIVIIIGQLYGIVLGIRINKEHTRDRLVCLESGYTELEKVGDTWYCIGVRDGQSVAVPISEVERTRGE